MTAGVGYCIHLNKTHHYEFALGFGYGTNTKAELMGLWALLLSSQMMGLPLVSIFGDSQVIVNWVKGLTALSQPYLFHWCRETKNLSNSFHDLSYIHIYREHNWIADKLSKTALTLAQGFGCCYEYLDDQLIMQESFQLF